MAWLPKETVVVPIDFSDISLAAVDTALGLVAGAGHLHVVHVLPPLSPVEPGVLWEAESDETRLVHTAEAMRATFSAAKYQGLKLVPVIGDPGRKITEYAQQHQTDLIVLPSHGRTGLERWLIGSVAERVVRFAHCPVLVLRN